jgi:hypothetical protein
MILKNYSTKVMSLRKSGKFTLNTFPKKPDHGLIPPKGEGYDQKWIFHSRADLRDMLTNGRLNYMEYGPYDGLIANLEFVQEKLLGYAGLIFEEIDKQIPGHHLLNQITDSATKNMHVMRLVEYIYQADAPVTNCMASAHTDQACFTAQWFESHSGLVLRDYNGNLVEYQYAPGKVIFFFGKKIEPATNGLLKPVEHWVDSRAKENRNAAIFFIHTPHKSVEIR